MSRCVVVQTECFDNFIRREIESMSGNTSYEYGLDSAEKALNS